MTDAELRDAAVKALKLTTVGFINKRWTTPPPGSHWQIALDYLKQIGQAPPPPPPPPPPSSLFTQNYTTAEVQALQQAGNIVAPHAYSVTFPKPDVARFEVRSGDQYATWSGERAQLQLPGIQGREGDRWHWAFTFTLDPAFQLPPVFNPNAGDYLVLWEHHHTGSTGSPPSTLQIKGTRLVWTQVRGADPSRSWDWAATDLGPAGVGSTVACEVDCILSADPAKAKTSVTVNGRVVNVAGPNLLSGMNVYVEWGLYRAPSPLTQVVTFGPVARLA